MEMNRSILGLIGGVIKIILGGSRYEIYQTRDSEPELGDLKAVIYRMTIVTIVLSIAQAGLVFLALFSSNGESREIAQDMLVLPALGLILLLAGYKAKGFFLSISLANMPKDAEISCYIGNYFVARILSLVFKQAAVISFFVYSFLSRDMSWILAGALVGIVLNIKDFPKLSELEAIIPPHLRQPEAVNIKS
jgi:hypothetical protein